MNKAYKLPLARKDLTRQFLSVFGETARYHHRMDVFRDFVTMTALAMSNTVDRTDLRETREAEYMTIAKRYAPQDMERMRTLFGIVQQAMEVACEDFLGSLFMDLELGDARRGQFYTPHPISVMMAEMTFATTLEKLDTEPFITVSEPACGAGGMILPLSEIMRREGHEPADKLFVQAVDVDRTAALMCYIQLSLWAIPAEIIVGNALTLEIRETWFTTMYVLNGWRRRLAARGMPPGFAAPARG